MNLSFRLGSIPARVHGSFFLIVIMFGLNDPSRIVMWVAVAFVGVLLHELGHALVGRSFGLAPRIDLIGFGGLTSWSGAKAGQLGPPKRIAISLAGPFTGIAIGLGTLVFIRVKVGLPPFAFSDHATPWTPLVSTIVWVNAGWGILNLLPVLPLDGGNVLFQGLDWLLKGNGEKPARYISTAAAALIGLAALKHGEQYGALMMGIFAVQNIQALRASTSQEKDAPLVDLLKAGFTALNHGDPSEGVRIGRDVLARASGAAVRSDAARLLAFGYVLTRDWEALAALMESPASSVIPPGEIAKFEQAARELGRVDVADRIAGVRQRRIAL